jgi:hypothetical protein
MLLSLDNVDFICTICNLLNKNDKHKKTTPEQNFSKETTYLTGNLSKRAFFLKAKIMFYA